LDILEQHLLSQLKTTFRQPIGVLKHPFFVPGGLFHDELWDWDSWLITKGVLGNGCGWDRSFMELFLEHAIGSWKNFFENQDESGAVPIMIKSEAGDYFKSLGRGMERNQAKPVFGQFAMEICRYTGDFSWVKLYFDRLLKFYDRWDSRYGSSCGLLIWGSDVAIGVDNDPTIYGRPEFSSASPLLNCLFYNDLLATAEIAIAIDRAPEACRLRERAEAVKEAVQKECWDAVDGFYYTVDILCGDHRTEYLPGLNRGMETTWRTLPLKVKMFSGFVPMWCGVASVKQAAILVEQHFRNAAEFDAPWGLRSLAMNEKMYDPVTNSANPSNWLGPVWIVAAYMVYEGLKRYGYCDDATQLADRIRTLLEKDIRETGTIHECYNPDTGEPNFNADFLSWNILVLLMS
jgi:putative isomerase